MFLGLLILLVALSISGVSAYYSILGLTAIFAADPLPIIIMGAVLEAGKVSTAVWLHYNWDRISLSFKLYMVPALVFLMMLTSMGVFGFLSKAHIDQGLPTATVQSKIDIINQQIKNKQIVIDSDQLTLQQLDKEVSQVMSRSNTVYGARLSGEIMRRQKAQRDQLTQEITTAQEAIINLKTQEQPLITQTSKLSAEVGPIKYIAALIYGAKGDNPDLLQSAVRWVSLLIVVVFDPLALMLILAGTKQLGWSRKSVEDPRVVKLNSEVDSQRALSSKLEQELSGTLDKQIDLANKNSTLLFEQKDFLRIIEEHKAAISAMKLQLLELPGVEVKEVIKEVPVEVIKEVVKEVPVEVIKEVVKEVPVEVIKEVVKEVPVTVEVIKEIPVTVEVIKEVIKEVPVTDSTVITALRAQHRQEIESLNARINELLVAQPTAQVVSTPEAEIQPLPPVAELKKFGNEFPGSPRLGEFFMRIDFRPTRLFKWNGVTWIGINKNITSDYSVDKGYLNALIQKLDQGEYSVSELTPDEMSQIRAMGRTI